ncbi:MAG: alpha-L-fucosidase, partial [Planctomycetota bacterium]
MIDLLTTFAAASIALAAPPAAPADDPPRMMFEPTWESLETHPTPEWFEDGKFGIFIH